MDYINKHTKFLRNNRIKKVLLKEGRVLLEKGLGRKTYKVEVLKKEISRLNKENQNLNHYIGDIEAGYREVREILRMIVNTDSFWPDIENIDPLGYKTEYEIKIKNRKDIGNAKANNRKL